MRASRLLSTLLLLQTRGQLTAAELAQQLEVSVRTIYRDVEALSEAGVPIYTERGPHGGIRLVDGYRTRLTGLTSDEAEALFLSGLPGPAAELGLGTVVAAARLKVLAALPPELRSRATRLGQRFHLDAPGWFRSSEAAPHLQSLANAVWDDRRIRIGYDRGDRAVERLLDPLGLVIKGGVWYLVALADGQPRTYRVSRVLSVSLDDAHFERPEAFDLATFWTETTAAYEARADRIEVRLRVEPGHISWLGDALGEDVLQTAIPLDEPDPEGWTHLRLVAEWPRDVHGRILAMGAYVEVLDPPELRERLIGSARDLLGRYAVAAG
jgi:predicted DNA-binding transcriptional regulator YafY